MTNLDTAAPPRINDAELAKLAPYSYVVIFHSQHCSGCGTLHEWSELYEKRMLRSRWGMGLVTNLRPLRTPPEFNIPIDLIRRDPKPVPFCHECAWDHSLAHLPIPAQEQAHRIVSIVEPNTPIVAKVVPLKTPRPKQNKFDDLIAGL